MLRQLAAAGTRSTSWRAAATAGTATAPEAVWPTLPGSAGSGRRARNVWTSLPTRCGLARHLRFCEPRYADTPRLRMRVRTCAGHAHSHRQMEVFERALASGRSRRACGCRAPYSRVGNLDTLMRECRPDVVLLNLFCGSAPRRWRCAERTRVWGTHGLCVATGITSRARPHAELPDRCSCGTVRRREAVTLHGVPVTRDGNGAQCYDGGSSGSL